MKHYFSKLSKYSSVFCVTSFLFTKLPIVTTGTLLRSWTRPASSSDVKITSQGVEVHVPTSPQNKMCIRDSF